MKLWAISDLHIGYEENRRAVQALPAHPDDWLIIAGDTGESPTHLDFVLRTLRQRFAQLIWTPGNHDLWTPTTWQPAQRGVAHYERLVALCQKYGVLTPEDPYARWPGDGPDARDRPGVSLVRLLVSSRVRCRASAPSSGPRNPACDPPMKNSSRPIRTRPAMSGATRACDATEARLASLPPDVRLILANHFPLATRSRRAATDSAFLDLVWHDQDRRLASPLQRRGRRLRSSAPARVSRARRRAL